MIGAQNYTALPALRNSLNDAKAMTAALKGKGFQVESLYDPKTKREIKDAINRYFNLLRDEAGAVGIIYYAGHGMQYEGDNFMIPTTATLQNPGDLEDYCVKMNTVMAVLKSASKSLNILLLDACRSLPSFTRDTEAGLTRMDAPQGAIIVFATQPGKVASDGTGPNGLFTSKLLRVLNEPNLNITDVFKRVKQEVYADSKGSQLPSVEDNSIGGDFYFTPGNATTPKVTYSQLTQPEVRTEFRQPETNTEAALKSVTIGSQQWFSQNLNVDRFANDELIPQAQTDEEWTNAGANKQPAWCYYNNDPANGRIYGKLYNWYAVHDIRGLAPQGWHVPSDNEWTQLTNYLGGEETAGSKMKSTNLWEQNGNGNNSSGIAGLPGGMRGSDGTFGFLGSDTFWWSSSSYTTGKGLNRGLEYINDSASRTNNKVSCGLSVRCVRD